MMSFAPEREFTEHLRSISDAYPEQPSKKELIILWRKAFDAGQIFEEAVSEFILKLPIQNQIQSLDFILSKLTGEAGLDYEPVPWWIGQITGYNKRGYEKLLVSRYINIEESHFEELCNELALARSAGVSDERMATWAEVVSVLNNIIRYTTADLDYLEGDEKTSVYSILDDTVFSLAAAEISYKRHYWTVLELSKFYSSLISGHHSIAQEQHIKWIDYITEFCDLLTSEFTYSENKTDNENLISSGFRAAPNEELRMFLAVLAKARNYRREEILKILYPDRESMAQPSEPERQVSNLKWQGSKTDLAELGYALLEAGIINGPREAALKALADFFGQDLGNPAKHLQTLQKRKWDPGDKEPTTPLLDRLRASLKSLLRIKGISPDRK